jgi:hypothetical protein
MQQESLLEQLDWCFSSVNWISNYPNTLMIPLARIASDHVSCVIRIGTNIPKAKIFRFESYWVGQPRFLELVDVVWAWEVKASNSATKIVAKFKNMRRILKKWAFGL